MTTITRYKAVVGTNELLVFFDFHLHLLNELLVPLLLLLFVGDDVWVCGDKSGVRSELDVVKSSVGAELVSGSMTVPLGPHSGRPISHGNLAVPCTYVSPASVELNAKVLIAINI